jgi:hypothetical protein
VWKAAFEEEQRLAKLAAGEILDAAVVASKKTGKQYFLDKYAAQAEGGADDGDDLELDEEDVGEDDDDGFEGVDEDDGDEDYDGEEDTDVEDEDLEMLEGMLADRE